MYIKGQIEANRSYYYHLIVSPIVRVLEQYNSTYISTYIVFQYRLYSGGPHISFH